MPPLLLLVIGVELTIMLKSIEGIFRNGRVELLEAAPAVNEARVVVTFLFEPGSIDLAERGIDSRQAADLRQRLATFADDWDRPEMGVYDDEESR
jgi:hypothetical protein